MWKKSYIYFWQNICIILYSNILCFKWKEPNEPLYTLKDTINAERSTAPLNVTLISYSFSKWRMHAKKNMQIGFLLIISFKKNKFLVNAGLGKNASGKWGNMCINDIKQNMTLFVFLKASPYNSGGVKKDTESQKRGKRDRNLRAH